MGIIPTPKQRINQFLTSSHHQKDFTEFLDSKSPQELRDEMNEPRAAGEQYAGWAPLHLSLMVHCHWEEIAILLGRLVPLGLDVTQTCPYHFGPDRSIQKNAFDVGSLRRNTWSYVALLRHWHRMSAADKAKVNISQVFWNKIEFGDMSDNEFLLVFCGPDLDLQNFRCIETQGGEILPRPMNAIEISKFRRQYIMALALERYTQNPELARHEMGRGNTWARLCFWQAELFGLVIFLCDGLLTLRLTDTTGNANSLRFFVMTQKLPQELQMTVCQKAWDEHRNCYPQSDVVPLVLREGAFRYLASVFV